MLIIDACVAVDLVLEPLQVPPNCGVHRLKIAHLSLKIVNFAALIFILPECGAGIRICNVSEIVSIRGFKPDSLIAASQ